jgi:hypothetical protein
LANVPAWQYEQFSEAFRVLKLPGRQISQKLAPVILLYEPGLHCIHEGVDIFGANVPGKHSEHVVDPMAAELPGEHGSHAEAPV